MAEGSHQVAPEIRTALRHARPVAEHDALVASVPNNWRDRLFAIDDASRALAQRRQDPKRGTGVYADTAVGAAARELVQARDRLARAEAVVHSPVTPWRQHRRAMREADLWRRRARPPPTAGSDWPALSSPASTARTKHWPMTATTFVTG